MSYKAKTGFLDAKQRMILPGAALADDYDESAIQHYLRNGMIEEVAAPEPKPKTKKPAKPKETK